MHACMQMVDLTAQNMLATASRNRKEWGEELTKILARTGHEYAVRGRMWWRVAGISLFVGEDRIP